MCIRDSAWSVLCPVIIILLMILSFTYSEELKYGDYQYPRWSIALGWRINLSFILPIPLAMLYAFLRYSDSRISFLQRLRLLFVPDITKRKVKQQVENGSGLHLSSSSPPVACV